MTALTTVNGVQCFNLAATQVLFELFAKAGYEEVPSEGAASGLKGYRLIPLVAGQKSASDFLAQFAPDTVVYVEASAVPEDTNSVYDITSLSADYIAKATAPGSGVGFVPAAPNSDISQITTGNYYAVFSPPLVITRPPGSEFKRIGSSWGYYCKTGYDAVTDPNNPNRAICAPSTKSTTASAGGGAKDNTGLLILGVLAVAGIAALAMGGKGKRI